MIPKINTPGMPDFHTGVAYDDASAPIGAVKVSAQRDRLDRKKPAPTIEDMMEYTRTRSRDVTNIINRYGSHRAKETLDMLEWLVTIGAIDKYPDYNGDANGYVSRYRKADVCLVNRVNKTVR